MSRHEHSLARFNATEKLLVKGTVSRSMSGLSISSIRAHESLANDSRRLTRSQAEVLIAGVVSWGCDDSVASSRQPWAVRPSRAGWVLV